MLTCVDVEREAPSLVDPSVGDERMVCRFRAGKWRWTWHDERGRMLVEGPEHKSKWQAHRMLLEAIRDACSDGELSHIDGDVEFAIRRANAPTGEHQRRRRSA